MRVRGIVCATIGILSVAGMASARQVRFEATVGPAQVAQIAARELARWRYQIITSDSAAGLVVAVREGTLEELRDTVACRGLWTTSVDATHTLTVTAEPMFYGASVQIASELELPEDMRSFPAQQNCQQRPILDALEKLITGTLPPVPASSLTPSPIVVAPPQDANDDVLELVNAGVRESTVLLFIRNHRGVFRTDPKTVIELTEAGATDAVIEAMMAKTRGARAAPAPAAATPDAPPVATATGQAPAAGQASVLIGLTEAQVLAAIGTPPSLTQRTTWYYDNRRQTFQITFAQVDGRRVVTAVSPVDFDLDSIPIRRRR